MHLVIASLGFPVWLRITHYINLLFIKLLIRSGIQIIGALVNPTKAVLLNPEVSKQEYKPSQDTSYFWVNGAPPVEEEFKQLAENNFKDWRLEVKGLVVSPLCLSLDDLRAMPKQTQRTLHNCIQGWTGIAE